MERCTGIGNRPELQIQNVKQEKSYKCKQCWRCRRRGPWRVGGNHLFQPSRKRAAKNAAKNADKNLANKTLKNDLFFWPVWNYFWRVPWSHGGDFGVVRTYMVSKIQTVIFPKVVPSSLGTSRSPTRSCVLRKQWVDK